MSCLPCYVDWFKYEAAVPVRKNYSWQTVNQDKRSTAQWLAERVPDESKYYIFKLKTILVRAERKISKTQPETPGSLEAESRI